MKRVLIVFNSLILLLMFFTVISFSFSPKTVVPYNQRVLAAESTEFKNIEDKGFNKGVAQKDRPTINTLAGAFYTYLSRLVLLASVLAGIIGGYMYMYSSGDPKKIQTAKDIIYSALLGVIAVAFAYTFFNVILPQNPPPTP